jgi:DNA mismatch repair protein MutS2
MQQIHQKTLQDLEFPVVLEQLAARCNTELGKAAALEIQPLSDVVYLKTILGQTSEYLASFENDNRIPNHGFDAINGELKLLSIENTTLEISGFRRIGSICKTIGIHKKFFKKSTIPCYLLFRKLWKSKKTLLKK